MFFLICAFYLLYQAFETTIYNANGIITFIWFHFLSSSLNLCKALIRASSYEPGRVTRLARLAGRILSSVHMGNPS